MNRIRPIFVVAALAVAPLVGACSGSVDCEALGDRIQEAREAGSGDEAGLTAEYDEQCVSDTTFSDVQLPD